MGEATERSREGGFARRRSGRGGVAKERPEGEGSERRGGGGMRSRGIGDHAFNGLNSSDSTFREREAEGDGAQQFAIDIDRAAAHALEDAGFGERAAAEPGEDDFLAGSDILEDAEDFDLELFDAIAGEDGAADAMETWFDGGEREEVLAVPEGGKER